MKTAMIITILMILALSLAACGSGSTETTADNTLPMSTQLIVGTFMLEETDLAVDAQLAAELLPLWRVMRSLSASDTAAPEEIEAVVEQIQETMTPEQVQAIEDIQLTRDDMFALMQEQGLTMGGGHSTGGGNSSGSTSPSGGMPMPEGGFNAGGPGAGGGRGFSGQNLNPEQIATAQARRAAGGGNTLRTSLPLIDALIELLEGKVQS